ncbi:telomerase protein component 1 [Elysia marginata]|uniref:Telomerase protein component 1 n=1 Tax=Elysia marginata TaxID=1093978 RepID=A0AAV4JSH5_9GAST|nr:telomerase protein component 1 [Elysia marginata]
MIAQDKIEPTEITNASLIVTLNMAPLTFTYLIRSMSCLLNPSLSWSPLMTLSNREVCAAVKLRYLKSSDNSVEVNIHKLLAAFFRNQADPQKDFTWQSKNVRGFVELPYHLAAAGCLKELEDVLCNHQFIQAKCQLGMAAKLLEDFSPQVPSGVSRLQEKHFAAFQSTQRVQEYRSFVSRNFEILSSYPALEWQQAINEPCSSIPYKDAASNLGLRGNLSSYMEWSSKPEDVSECYLTLSNFKMPAVSVCVSPCSTMFATGSQDMIVRLYNMATGKEETSFIGHSDVVTDVCFVGSSLLCSASADCTLSLWDLENKHRISTLKGHNRRVNSCASDTQGKLVASGSWDCTVIVWKATESANKLCTLEVGSPVNCVDFHPSLEQVVVGSWDSLIRIYNYFHKTRIAVLRGHSTSVRDLSYSFDGHHLASASMDGDIKMWAADKGSQVGNIRGHSGPINKLTFSPNGKELITAGEDRQIKVWSGDLGIPLHCLHKEKLGAATSVSISPSGLTVAIGFHLGSVVLHDINTGAKIFSVKLGSFALRAIFSFDGNYILVGSDDSTTQVLHSLQGSKVCSLTGQTGPVLCVASSKSYVAVGGEDFTCCLYDNVNKLKSYKQSKPSVYLRGHVGPVTSCCFNEDETMLATASRDASVRLYAVRSVFIAGGGEPVRIIHDCHEDWINSCQWSNTGPYLVTASNDFNLKVFDTKTATEKLTLTGHNSAVNSVAYKYGCIVSGSSDGSLRVWSHKGTPITTLYGHTLRVNACDIFVKCKTKIRDDNITEQNWAEMAEKGDDDEKRPSRQKEVNVEDVIVVSVGDDGDAWIWKPLQANTLATLMGHSDRLLSVAVDKNNSMVSCSLDCSTKVWHPRLSMVPQGDGSKSAIKIESNKHDGPVTFLAMSSDLVAVSGSRDGTIKIWTQEENDSFKLMPRHTFQAHEKSVNCGCFNAFAVKIFATGGDDNKIHIWEICDRKAGFFIRKESSIDTVMPVACVLIPSPNLVCFATWCGNIFIVNSGKMAQKIFNIPTSAPGVSCGTFGAVDAKNWVCSMEFNGPDKSKIVFGTTNGIAGSLHFHATTDAQLTFDRAEVHIGAHHPVNKETVDGSEVPEQKKTPKWISALAHYRDVTLAGDSEGQLVAFQLCNGEALILTKKKVHKSAVTALVVVYDTVITGSSDGTIKIWSVAGTQLEQIGQFFCPSPVTSLEVKLVLQGSRNQPETILLVGDLLGNVHQLKWHA